MPTQNFTNISGTVREPSRQNNKELRSTKQVPAVLYGPEIEENIYFSVSEIELERILSKNQTKLQILTINGKEYKTLLKRTDFDPVTDRPIHADFYVLSPKHRVTLRVPVKVTGNARGVVQSGGRLFQTMVNVRVRVYPDFIPSDFVVDVTPLKIGDAIHVSELDLENIEPIDSLNRAVVTVQPPKKALSELVGDDDDEDDEDMDETEATEDGAAEGGEGAAEGAEE